MSVLEIVNQNHDKRVMLDKQAQETLSAYQSERAKAKRRSIAYCSLAAAAMCLFLAGMGTAHVIRLIGSTEYVKLCFYAVWSIAWGVYGSSRLVDVLDGD